MMDGGLSRIVPLGPFRPSLLMLCPRIPLLPHASLTPPDLASHDVPPQALAPAAPRAMFMDCSHDNETPTQKRSIADQLPNACLVAASCGSIGSTAGYDYFVPWRLDVVKEKRRYPRNLGCFTEIIPGVGVGALAVSGDRDKEKPVTPGTTTTVTTTSSGTQITPRGSRAGRVRRRTGSGMAEPAWCGMAKARAVLNKLHVTMAREGCTEMFATRAKDNIVMVHRHNPLTERGYVFLAHTYVHSFMA